MVERTTVQGPALGRINGLNSRSSRRVIQEGQLAKGLTRNIVLEIFGFLTLFEHLGAFEFARFNDVQVVAIFTLCDDRSSRSKCHLLHGTHDNLKLIRVQVAEHEGLAEAVS